PFDDTQDNSAASLEPGEPSPSCGSTSGTIWYAYTPTTSGSLSASGNGFPTTLAAYTGGSLSNLTAVGCRTHGERLTFHANAGTTYYFQLGNLYGQGGSLQCHLEVTPAPVASFYYYPSDASIFDTIQFYDNSYDPGNVGFQSYAWNFGDGATATGSSPT